MMIWVILIIVAIVAIVVYERYTNFKEIGLNINLPLGNDIESIEKTKALKIINSRKVLSDEGEYQVKVLNVVSWPNLFGGKIIHIDYDATTPLLLEMAHAMIEDKDYIEATKGNLTSRHEVENGISSEQYKERYMPKVGETIMIVLGYDEYNTSQLPDALRVIDWYPIDKSRKL